MLYSITFPETHFRQLVSTLFSDLEVERAAYLLCRTSKSRGETRLLVREILPVFPEDIISASRAHMSIRSASYMRAMKIADKTKHCFVFVHSHPLGTSSFSHQDDTQEAMLFRSAYTRISSPGPHASIVFGSMDDVGGRVWLPDGSHQIMDKIRVIGSSFKFFGTRRNITDLDAFDRQVKAFGVGIQNILGRLSVGIVGAGGTGSAVAEQLMRLGVGHIAVFDNDVIDKSNVTRVYGSGLSDAGRKKVDNIRRMARRVGLGTKVTAIDKSITFRSAAALLRECDIVFGCTDDEWGRSILCRLAIYYYIPVIDMGVSISSSEGTIRSVQGRVTTLIPGASCLFCRGRIGTRIAAEVATATNPGYAENLRREGYIPELEIAAPAVIPFTTAIASSAVMELIQRLTAFMGTDRESTELLQLFDQTRIRTNKTSPNLSCFCDSPEKTGRGDCQPLLDLTWRKEANG
jgi:molybdopterin/thiamine biosynthesis adenylyltransferase